MKTIDGLSFARMGGRVEFDFPVHEFDRLADVLGSVEGVIKGSLEGKKDKRGRSFLALTLRGNLHLVCQRCLKPMPFTLDESNVLELVRHESEDAEFDSEFDEVVASKEMSIKELVQDEVILALPMIPMHENCVALEH